MVQLYSNPSPIAFSEECPDGASSAKSARPAGDVPASIALCELHMPPRGKWSSHGELWTFWYRTIMTERAVLFIRFGKPVVFILVELERVLLSNFWFGKLRGTMSYSSSLDLRVWVQF